jgi:hypothetical protein
VFSLSRLRAAFLFPFSAAIFRLKQVPVTVPNAPVGSQQNFVIRAWEAGKTFDTSLDRGEASFLSRPLGGPVPGNPDAARASLLGFNGFTMIAFIPEPSTIASVAVGIGALLLRRRK